MSKPEPVIPARADPGLTLEEMKAFVRNHFDDFVNRKKSAVALQNFSEDFLDHDEPGGVAVGAQAAKTMMEGVYEKWPDLHVTIEDILAEGDKVIGAQPLAGDRARLRPANRVPRLRPLEIRPRKNRGTLGHDHFTPTGLNLS